MIWFEIIALIGTIMTLCGLAYEQRRSPYTWLIVALVVWFIGNIAWHAHAAWLRDFTVVAAA